MSKGIDLDDTEQDDELEEQEGGIRIGGIYIPPPPMPSCTFDATGPRLIISKIENHNFKSYAGQTDLGPFHKNFTSIVGPNGSGKSNVIDSMLFVFGFRASKIRTNKVGVLVHLSDNYPNLKSCTVRVHFQKIRDIDDENYEPIPGTEFYIGRTAFKDNTSYYEINGKRCKFQAVGALLRSHGIDLDHNRFLILQGEIEMIAMMKPKGQDNSSGMLEYLEDIIGCNRFIKPIEEFAHKVEELNEIRTEKLNRVKLVEKEKDDIEAAKNEAIEYIKLENKITVLENTMFQSQLRDKEAEVQQAIVDRDECKQQLQILENKKEEVKLVIKEKETLRAKVQAEYEKSHAVSEKVRHKFIDLEKRDVIVREDLNLMKGKVPALEKNINTEEKKLKELQQQPEQMAKEISELEEKESVLEKKREAEQKKLKEVIASTNEETESLQVEKERHEARLMEMKTGVNELSAKVDLAQSDLDMYLNSEKKEKIRLKEFEEKLSETTDKIATLERNLRESTTAIPQLESSLKKLKTEREQVTQKELKINEEMKDNRTKLEEMKSAQNSARTRGVIPQFLLQKQREGKLRGVFGRLGDLGGIDKNYDIAISTACPALDNILTDTVDTAQECIKFLKAESKGYTTIIALEKMNRFAHIQQKKDFTNTGYPENVPRLFDLVTVKDPKVLPALYFVMRETLVAKDIEQATRIGLNSHTRYKVVTLKGEVIDVAGTMSGGGNRKICGRMGKSAAGAEVNPRDLEILERTIEEQARAITACRDRKGVLDEEIAAHQKSLATNSHLATKSKNEYDSSKDYLAQLTREIEEQRPRVEAAATDPQRVKELEKTFKTHKTAFDKASAEASEVENQVKRLQCEITSITKGKLGAAQKLVDKVVKELETIRASINKCKTTAKTANRNQKKSETKIASLKKELEDLKANIEKLVTELTELDTRGTLFSKERDAAKETLDKLTEEKLEIQKQMEKVNEEEMKIRCAHVEQTNALKQKEAVLKEKEDSARRVKSSLMKLKLQMLDEDDPDTPTELPTLTSEELDKVSIDAITYEIGTFQAQMGKMKPNMAAIAEFKKKEELYRKKLQEFEHASQERDEMKKHHDDLRKQRLDEFLKGFTIITSKLKEVYQMITLGGDAELELVDSLDPFTEGIVFSVRPPKKSWKNISNLSGGEKTLSSLALVFALHYYKPTPFYVMDEIDAALDFKNVSIVGNYIQERTKNAQFIIISLRNNMFELANRLVGIFKTYNCTKTCTISPIELASGGGDHLSEIQNEIIEFALAQKLRGQREINDDEDEAMLVSSDVNGS